MIGFYSLMNLLVIIPPLEGSVSILLWDGQHIDGVQFETNETASPITISVIYLSQRPSTGTLTYQRTVQSHNNEASILMISTSHNDRIKE
jgi:hypothetical protein